MGYKCILDSETKVVVNVILLEDGVEWTLPDGQEFAPQHDGNMGETWDGEKFVAPVEPLVVREELLAPGAAPNVIG
jgi:hypothetical protein